MLLALTDQCGVHHAKGGNDARSVSHFKRVHNASYSRYRDEMVQNWYTPREPGDMYCISAGGTVHASCLTRIEGRRKAYAAHAHWQAAAVDQNAEQDTIDDRRCRDVALVVSTSTSLMKRHRASVTAAGRSTGA